MLRRKISKFFIIFFVSLLIPHLSYAENIQVSCPFIHLHLFTFKDGDDKPIDHMTSIRSCCIKGSYIYLHFGQQYTVITDCVGNDFDVEETPDEIEDMEQQQE